VVLAVVVQVTITDKMGLQVLPTLVAVEAVVELNRLLLLAVLVL